MLIQSVWKGFRSTLRLRERRPAKRQNGRRVAKPINVEACESRSLPSATTMMIDPAYLGFLSSGFGDASQAGHSQHANATFSGQGGQFGGGGASGSWSMSGNTTPTNTNQTQNNNSANGQPSPSSPQSGIDWGASWDQIKKVGKVVYDGYEAIKGAAEDAKTIIDFFKGTSTALPYGLIWDMTFGGGTASGPEELQWEQDQRNTQKWNDDLRQHNDQRNWQQYERNLDELMNGVFKNQTPHFPSGNSQFNTPMTNSNQNWAHGYTASYSIDENASSGMSSIDPSLFGSSYQTTQYWSPNIDFGDVFGASSSYTTIGDSAAWSSLLPDLGINGLGGGTSSLYQDYWLNNGSGSSIWDSLNSSVGGSVLDNPNLGIDWSGGGIDWGSYFGFGTGESTGSNGGDQWGYEPWLSGNGNGGYGSNPWDMNTGSISGNYYANQDPFGYLGQTGSSGYSTADFENWGDISNPFNPTFFNNLYNTSPSTPDGTYLGTQGDTRYYSGGNRIRVIDPNSIYQTGGSGIDWGDNSGSTGSWGGGSSGSSSGQYDYLLKALQDAQNNFNKRFDTDYGSGYGGSGSSGYGSGSSLVFDDNAPKGGYGGYGSSYGGYGSSYDTGYGSSYGGYGSSYDTGYGSSYGGYGSSYGTGYGSSYGGYGSNYGTGYSYGSAADVENNAWKYIAQYGSPADQAVAASRVW